MLDQESLAIACELTASEQSKRSMELQNGLFADCRAVEERPDGYGLRFDWDPERLRALGDFLAVESDCCPFLRHRVDVAPGRSDVWLSLEGSPAAKRVLASELLPLLPASVTVSQPDLKRKQRSLFRGGIVATSAGALLAVLCCAAPTALVAIGLGAAGAHAAQFERLGGALLLVGVVMVAFGLLKRRARAHRDKACGCS